MSTPRRQHKNYVSNSFLDILSACQSWYPKPTKVKSRHVFSKKIKIPIKNSPIETHFNTPKFSINKSENVQTCKMHSCPKKMSFKWDNLLAHR